jgi:hypothetical protein
MFEEDLKELVDEDDQLRYMLEFASEHFQLGRSLLD